MFERFTDRARRVVTFAQDEARLLNHNYIGTEHILLGLIKEGEGVACKSLESLDISLEKVRDQVEDIIGQGTMTPTGHIPFTPRAKKILELSLREALQLGHNYIGTEHILLGIIREGEGVAAQVLVKLGGDLNRVRQVIIQLLAGYSSKTPEVVLAAAEADVAGGILRIEKTGSKGTFSATDSSGKPVEVLKVSVKFRDSDGTIRSYAVDWSRSKPKKSKKKGEKKPKPVEDVDHVSPPEASSESEKHE